MMKSAICFLMCLCLSSCLDYEASFLVNPDYSASIHVKTKAAANPPAMAFFGLEKEPFDLEKEFVNHIDDFLDLVPEADAWENITYKASADSQSVIIEGTAYMRDIRAEAAGSGESSRHPGLTPLLITEQGDKINVEIDMRIPNDPATADDEDGARSEKNLAEITGEQVSQQISTIRRMNGLLIMMLEGFRMRATYDMPGLLVKSEGFLLEDGKIGIEFDGTRIAKELSAYINNDSLLEADIRRGKGDFFSDGSISGKGMDDEETRKIVLRMLFGTEAVPKAVFSKENDMRFDYDKRVSGAMPQWEEIRKQYKTEAKSDFRYDEKQYLEPDPDLRHH